MRSSAHLVFAGFCLCWLGFKAVNCQLELDSTYCDKIQFGDDLQFECKDSKTLAYGKNNTYSWEVDSETAEKQPYDILITVETSSGDAAV